MDNVFNTNIQNENINAQSINKNEPQTMHSSLGIFLPMNDDPFMSEVTIDNFFSFNNKKKDNEEVNLKHTLLEEIQKDEKNSNVNDIVQNFHLNNFNQKNNQNDQNENISDKKIEDINYYKNFDEEQKLKKSYSIIDDDYLKIEDLKINENYLKDEYNKLCYKFSQPDLAKLKEAICIKTVIENSNIRVGLVSSLDYLVESSYNFDFKRKDSMIQNMVNLDSLVFSWRKICGDGNCYYRAVIFFYLEKLIFDKKINLFLYFMIDFSQVINSYELKDTLQKQNLSEKTELVVKILFLIYQMMNSNEEKNLAYEIFYKAYNLFTPMDLCLILYLRYKIYSFIKQNENKLYTKEFSVKIGNLLPGEYETESGEFLWEKFYKDYLLKLFKDAEKIIIYLTPFVLKINLKILIFDFGKNYVDQMKEFPCFLDDQKNSHSTITLLYKRTHYDLIYEKQYFEKYVKFLSVYVSLNENLKVLDDNALQTIKMQKNGSKSNLQTAPTMYTNQTLQTMPTIQSIGNNLEKDKEKSNKVGSNSNLIQISHLTTINEKEAEKINNNIKAINVKDLRQNNNSNNNLLQFDLKKVNALPNQSNLANLISQENFNTNNLQMNYHSNDNKSNFYQNINSLQGNKNNGQSSNIDSLNKMYSTNIVYNKMPLEINSQVNSQPHYPDLTSKHSITPRTSFCSICKNVICVFPGSNNSQFIIPLCNTCFLTELKTYALSNYFIFLITSKENFRVKKSPEESVKLFQESKININLKIVFIQRKIKIVEINIDISSACKLANSDLNNVIYDLKTSFCSFCENSININNSTIFYKLPCGCLFCNEKCIKNYFDLLFYNYEPSPYNRDGINILLN